MPRAGDLLDIHWRRWSRWCLLGTFVMALWLLWPTIACSAGALRETPMDTVEQGAKSDEKPGFFGTWWAGTKRCYAATPMFGQEQWKTMLLLSFAGATVVTRVIA